MSYGHGHVVSIPDPHGTRPSRPAVIVSDEDCPDHGSPYTVAAMTGSQRYGQTRYAVGVAEDEPEVGELLKRSYVEPWATEQIAHGVPLEGGGPRLVVGTPSARETTTFEGTLTFTRRRTLRA